MAKEMVSINDNRTAAVHRDREALWEYPESGTQTIRYLHEGSERSRSSAPTSAVAGGEDVPLLGSAGQSGDDSQAHPKLGQLPATAISGNDIMCEPRSFFFLLSESFF